MIKEVDFEDKLQDGDYIIKDLNRLNPSDFAYHVFIHYGEEIGTFMCYEDAIETIGKKMDSEGYYPNVWNEHSDGSLEITLLVFEEDW